MLSVNVSPFPLVFIATPGRRDVALDSPRMSFSAPETADDDDQAGMQAHWLTEMARGEKNALALLYDALSRPLFSLALRIVIDRTAAEDIVQEVFLQMWRKAGTYDAARGSVFSWATTLTRNRAIDHVRKQRRRTGLLTGSAADLQPEPLSGDLDAAGSLWLREKARAIRSALGQLAPDQQEAIKLAFFSGLTQLQIAEQLREPLGTIKARIRRGLLKLKETLPTRL